MDAPTEFISLQPHGLTAQAREERLKRRLCIGAAILLVIIVITHLGCTSRVWSGDEFARRQLYLGLGHTPSAIVNGPTLFHLWKGSQPPLPQGRLQVSRHAMSIEDIQKMRIKQIKEELKKRGVGCDDCFEKADLVDRLYQALLTPQQATGIVLKMTRIVPAKDAAKQGITMDNYNEFFGVDVKFLNSPYPNDAVEFLIDTASPSLISPDVARLFGGRPAGMGSRGSVAASNERVEMGPIVISEKAVDYKFTGIVSDIPPLDPRLEGILGLEFFGKFDVLLNFREAQCSLYLKGSCQSSAVVNGMREIPLDLSRGMPMVQVTLMLQEKKGTPILAIIGTGAARTTMNMRAAATLGISNDALAQLPRKRMVEAADGTKKVIPVVDLDIAVGDIDYGMPVAVGVAESQQPSLSPHDEDAVVLLGNDFLKKFNRILISLATCKLWLPEGADAAA